MDQKQIIREIIAFNKTAFENNFKAMITFRNQTDQFILRLLDQATWTSNDQENIMTECISVYKIGHENFKTCCDEAHQKVIDYFAQAQTQEGRKDKK